MKANLPKVPNFIEANLPKFNPGFILGPPKKQTHELNFIELYFNGDVRTLLADALGRPEHYTAEQKAILEAMSQKQPLPPGTKNTDINEIVMRFTERTEHRKEREKIVQRLQEEPKKTEDPTIERYLEEAKNQTFQNQETIPKAIKII